MIEPDPSTPSRAHPPYHGPAHPELPEPRRVDANFIALFRTKLRQENLSANTQDIYLGAARLLARWLAAEDGPTFGQVSKFDFRRFVVWMQEEARTRKGKRFSEGYISNQFRALQQFFAFLEEDCDIKNPMSGVRPPKVHAPKVPVITEDQIIAMLQTVRARSNFESRRDYAILLLFLSTGLRLDELAQMTTAIDVALDAFVVTGKGGKQRLVTLVHEAQFAIHRYMISRNEQAQAWRSEMWIGVRGKGPLTGNGIRQMIRRRARAVGIEEQIHPHKFRHTFAHRFKVAGGQDSDLMELMGWSSAAMVRRYGSSAAQERAVGLAHQLMPDILPELRAPVRRRKRG